MNVHTSHPLIGMPAGYFEPSPAPGAPYYRFNGNYPVALANAGATPVALPLDLPEEILHDLFLRLDGLCLAGGDDVGPAHYSEAPHPALKTVDAARDETEITLTRWALAADMPILGICRGIQVLNVAAGGDLYQDLPAQRPGAIRHAYPFSESPWERPTHAVRVEVGSQLAGALGAEAVMVNSFHHQAVRKLAPGFVPVAWAEDGVVEGLEHPDRVFALAVQWHPEAMVWDDVHARNLFAAFVGAARRCVAATNTDNPAK